MKGIVCPVCRNLVTKVEVGASGVRVEYPDALPMNDGTGRYYVTCSFDSCGHQIILERSGETAYDTWPYRVVMEPA